MSIDIYKYGLNISNASTGVYALIFYKGDDSILSDIEIEIICHKNILFFLLRCVDIRIYR